MRTVAQILYEVHEEKKRELYSMPIKDAMRNGAKAKTLVKLIELTGDILNMEVNKYGKDWLL